MFNAEGQVTILINTIDRNSIRTMNKLSGEIKGFKSELNAINKQYKSGMMDTKNYYDITNILQKRMKSLQNQYAVAKEKAIPLRTEITKSTSGLGKQQEVMVKNVYRGKQLISSTTQITKGLKAFKMEFLGVMFAGMQLNQSLANLTKGAMDWLGVNELMGFAMDYLMFKAVEPFAESMYGAADALINFADNMDPVSKGFLGLIAIGGQGLGMVLQLTGGLVLAMSSLVQAYPTLRAVAAPAIGGILSGMGILLGNVRDMPPEFRLIGSTIAAMGAAIASTPIADLLKGIPIVGEGLSTLTPFIAGGTAFMMADGVGNIFDVFAKSADILSNKAKDVPNNLEPVRIEMSKLGDSTTLTYQKVDILTSSLSKPYTGTFNMTGNLNDGLDEITRKLLILQTLGISTKTTTPILHLKSYNPWSQMGVTTTGVSMSIPRERIGYGATGQPYVKSEQYGGIVPGRFGEPVPIIAHGGERFMGTHGEYGGGSTVNFSPTYNITVSDAREFEAMIKANNDNVIRELKSMVI